VVFYALLDNRGWVYWAEHWRGEGYGAAEGPCDILQVECYKLERVVGSKRVRVMCTDKGPSGGRMCMYRLIGGLLGVGRRSGRGRTSFFIYFSFFLKYSGEGGDGSGLIPSQL